MTFGRAISEARKKMDLSQKELARMIKKEGGSTISPQYLNDIEHDRRKPSPFVIEQLAKVLKLERDYLYHLAGLLPVDLKERIVSEERTTKAYRAFRRELRKGS